jgi:hypothetical protein
MARRGQAALREAKEKKQKKIAIVGAVLLVIVLAIQGPRTWNMLKGSEQEFEDEPTAVATTPTAPVGAPVSLEPPTLAGPAGAPPPTGSQAASGGSEPAPLASSGQLVSFSRFESKDPFVPQLSEDGDSPARPGEAARPGAARPGASAPAVGQDPPAATGVALAAVISVNGARETVAPGRDFPAASPLFRLVSLTKTTAAIAIAGGDYADGAETVKLRRGQPLTLMNTADGVRYELRLISFIWGSAPES